MTKLIKEEMVEKGFLFKEDIEKIRNEAFLKVNRRILKDLENQAWVPMDKMTQDLLIDIINNQKPIDPEIQNALNKEFWNLI